MRVRYDPASGALYFRLREGTIEETVELPTPGAYADVDAAGHVVGLEFLSVHEFLGFLVAMGGEAAVPERIDPARPGPALRRFSSRTEGGPEFPQSVHEAPTALDAMMERAAAAAQQVQERAGQVAEQVADQATDVQESSMRLSRRFFENWVETLEDHAELNRRTMQGLTELVRDQQEFLQEISQESLNAYESFLDSLSSYYEESQPNATEAAKRKAAELGVDLSRVEGTGSGGRITLKDVLSTLHRD